MQFFDILLHGLILPAADTTTRFFATKILKKYYGEKKEDKKEEKSEDKKEDKKVEEQLSLKIR